MTKAKRIEKIMREIKMNVGWLENGQPRELNNASLSTIQSILEVNLLKRWPSQKDD